MIPVVTASRMTGAARRAELPLLVLGPSLGTSATALWTECAGTMTDAFDVLAWDLPGHGHNRSIPEEPFSVAELAMGVLATVSDVQEQRGDPGAPFDFAGVSIGGAVGLQLLLDHPERVTAAALLCTGARILDPEAWALRVSQVESGGTEGILEASAERWFGPGFIERSAERATGLLAALRDVDDRGYVLACQALAGFDVRARLAEISQPVLAIAGSDDLVTPPASLRAIADTVAHGSYVELAGVSHLAPAEQPLAVSRLVRAHLLGDFVATAADGVALRRAVLGDAHVDRSLAGATELTREFQEFITEHAWGAVWARPGLDLRSRSMVTVAALVTGGHTEELALHLHGARNNGLSWEEIKEVLIQTAVYAGVPAANTAFRIAQRVFDEEQA